MEDALRNELNQLFALMQQRGLRELTVSRPDFYMSATALQAVAATMQPMLPVAMAAPVAAVAPAAPQAAPAKESVEEGYAVASPLVGIFYRSPSPDAPPFVEVGDTVEAGETIGIVEAMKVFNEITADRAGTVIATPVENGVLVQAGQPLVVLDTLS